MEEKKGGGARVNTSKRCGQLLCCAMQSNQFLLFLLQMGSNQSVKSDCSHIWKRADSASINRPPLVGIAAPCHVKNKEMRICTNSGYRNESHRLVLRAFLFLVLNKKHCPLVVWRGIFIFAGDSSLRKLSSASSDWHQFFDVEFVVSGP